MEAFLEYDHPSWTMTDGFETSGPPTLGSVPSPLLAMARRILAEKPSADDFPKGKGLVLVRDDAAGDPASLATHCIGLIKGLDALIPEDLEQDDFPADVKDLVIPLHNAVNQQLNFLLNEAPRVSIQDCNSAEPNELIRVNQTNEGAISHRLGHVSLWADFIYMVGQTARETACINSL
jgi:hypothetical protein